MKKVAIIIAGGSGQRMGQDIPKQFLNVGEKPVIMYTLDIFQKHCDIDGIIVVCIDGWHEILRSYVKQYKIDKLKAIVTGGATGQESIKNGLKEATRFYSDEDIVLIHDAVRPMVSNKIISDVIKVCEEKGNATAVIPCTTVVLKKDNDIYSDEIVDREHLYLTQTPQAFILGEILDAHKEAENKGIKNSVASCSLYITLGKNIYYSLGDETNIKLTRPGDIQIFKALLNTEKSDWMK